MSDGRTTPQPPGAWPYENDVSMDNASGSQFAKADRPDESAREPAISGREDPASSTIGQRRYSAPPKLIAIFGRTGTGKTSFIEDVSGEKQGVGHDLTSYTTDVLEVLCEIDGQAVVLVDTPGFDDTNLSDVDVLTKIADWMRQTYDEGVLLSGIIYLHRISDNRMEGSETLNLRMFKKLCGMDNLKNVILATTMWDLTPEADALRREGNLRDIFWKDMLAKDSTMERIYKQPGFAKTLVRKVLSNDRMVTRLQEQMGAGKQLRDTDAGAEMTKELGELEARLTRKYEAALATQRALRNGDLETQRDLRVELEVMTRQLAGVQERQETLIHHEPKRKLPVQRRRWNQHHWRCLGDCGRKTGKYGRWTCPNEDCNMRQRNLL